MNAGDGVYELRPNRKAIVPPQFPQNSRAFCRNNKWILHVCVYYTWKSKCTEKRSGKRAGTINL